MSFVLRSSTYRTACAYYLYKVPPGQGSKVTDDDGRVQFADGPEP